MDPAYVHSWLREAQQFRSFPLLREDSFREGVYQPNPMTPFSTSVTAPPANEPLDLSVKSAKPCDSSVPLDLSVSKSTHSAPSTDHTPRESHRTASGILSESALSRTLQYQSVVNALPSYTQCQLDILPHSSDRKLHCSYCGYQCEVHLKASFDQHTSNHKPQPSCIHCQTMFPDTVALQEHLHLHDLLYIHICTTCGLAFKLQLAYSEHVAECHAPSEISKPNENLSPQSAPDRSLLKMENSPRFMAERYRSSSMSCSSDHHPSSSSHIGASTSKLSPLSQMTLGESLAPAIAQQVSDAKPMNLAEIIFMKSKDEYRPAKQTPTLNLRSLLEKVVEESIRVGPSGVAEKPNLKFMVTFSDEEDEEGDEKECNDSSATAVNFSATVSAAKSPSDDFRSSQGERSEMDLDKTG